MIENFHGEYYHQIDQKSRLSIPRKFANQLRSEENGRIILARGVDRCLWLYPASRFNSAIEYAKKFPLYEPRAQKFFNTFFSGSHEDTIDKSGRILIPKHLADYAGIIKNVVLVGSLSHIQIWSESTWIQQLDFLTHNVNDIANEMREYLNGLNNIKKDD